MKQNKHVKRKLSSYLDGELNDADRQVVETHLQSCIGCAEEKHRLEQVWETLDILPEANPLPFLYTRIRSRLDADENKSLHNFWEQFLIPVSSIAVIVIGIYFGGQVAVTDPVPSSRPAEEWLGVLELDSFSDFPEDSFSQIYFESGASGRGEGSVE